MKTTGLFTVHEFTIHIDGIDDTIYLYPIGDVHKYAPLHSSERWSEFLDKVKSRGKKAYLFGMGDYMDFMSSSERSNFTKSEFHDSTVQRLDKMADEDVAGLYKDLKFAEGRVIGLIEGNHYYQFNRGETSTQTLCRLLNTKYLGVATFTRLRFVHKNHFAVMDVFAHHGKGAARLLGGSLNRVQQMAESAEADIYLMGHDHKGPVGKNPRLRLSHAGSNLAVVERPQLFARTGSFLRGYVDGEVSYVADGCMNPANLGGTEISFTFGRPGNNTTLKVDVHATI